MRSELLTLSRDVADLVARHLVAAGQIIDEDPDLALAHAVAARRLASRIAVVREAVGLAAYAAGDWATAIAELRTYHRMTGRQTHLAEIADSERALGRPERAIDLYRGADLNAVDKAGGIELLIVAAGARADLGQHDAAVSMLKVPELTAYEDGDWAPRLRYAYADALLAAGRREDAREWFSRAAAIDNDDTTDAAERLLELDGITIEDDIDNEESSDDKGDEHITGTVAESAVDVSDQPTAGTTDGEVSTAAGEPAQTEGEPVQTEGEPVAELAGDDPADEEWSEEHDFTARTRALSFMDAATAGDVPQDRLADDVDGGIDEPSDDRAPADVDADGPEAGQMTVEDGEKAEGEYEAGAGEDRQRA